MSRTNITDHVSVYEYRQEIEFPCPHARAGRIQNAAILVVEIRNMKFFTLSVLASRIKWNTLIQLMLQAWRMIRVSFITIEEKMEFPYLHPQRGEI